MMMRSHGAWGKFRMMMHTHAALENKNDAAQPTEFGIRVGANHHSPNDVANCRGLKSHKKTPINLPLGGLTGVFVSMPDF